MLVLISPSKKLDDTLGQDTVVPPDQWTQPGFLTDSQHLIKQLRKLSPAAIASLMHLSDNLAHLNAERFERWHLPFTPENARAAILAFKGDVYEGMQAATMEKETLLYAQQHLRILSGLYGVLRPLDLMQAYRLEMGSALQNTRGKDLYAFWGERLTKRLNADLAESGSQVVVNLASNEYFKAVQPRKLKAQLITPAFKDWKNGEYKMISFFAKKARGMMTRYIMDHRLDDKEALLGFDGGGYAYNPELTRQAEEPVFTRRADAA